MLQSNRHAGPASLLSRLVRVGTAALASVVAFAASPASADAVTFDFTGGFETYVVPATGTYTITAAGAQGGSSTFTSGAPGGLGAQVGGDFRLTQGQILTLAVGGQGLGPGSRGGGGGGSFVVSPGDVPLLVAGGGGGASLLLPGEPGLATVTGGAAVPAGGAGGTAGNGGFGGGFSGAGGGGGFLTNGTDGSNVPAGQAPSSPGFGGQSYQNGLDGGIGITTFGSSANGGFGGGGGAGGNGGGGGGGYSGGGGAGALFANGIGGGGGSFLAPFATETFATSGLNACNGFITITAVPEPSAAFGVLALGGLIALRRRRRTY